MSTTNATATTPAPSFVGFLATLFIFLIGIVIMQVVLTIAYAVYLAKEERALTGSVSTRRMLESAITVVGAVETAVWFLLIIMIWYAPILFGTAMALGVAGLAIYIHSTVTNHALPGLETEAYALVSIPLLAMIAYTTLGSFGLVVVAESIIMAFIITDIIIYLMGR